MAYANRSNARRAAKAAGLENFEVVTVDGGFEFRELAADVVADVLPGVVAQPAAWQWPTGAAHNAGPRRPARRGRPRISEVRNGARKPVAGVCATLWAHFDTLEQATVAAARQFAEANQLNLSNATQEFYAWRKFNAA
jgi:hypothetical protein